MSARSRSRSVSRDRFGRGRRDESPAQRSVSRSLSPDSTEKACCVYVGNLSFECTAEDLKDYMKRCLFKLFNIYPCNLVIAGEIVRVSLMTVPGGRSKGCGIVQYTTPKEALRAIRDLSQASFMGRTVFIREDRGVGEHGTRPPRSSHRPHEDVRSDGTQIFVGNVRIHCVLFNVFLLFITVAVVDEMVRFKDNVL